VSDARISQDQNNTPEDAVAGRSHIPEGRAGATTSPHQRTPKEDNMIDIVDEILAVDPAKFLQWVPEGRPEYVNGNVHLTDAQWQRILAARPAASRHIPPARAVWGIPVVLHPNPTPARADR
jgi:hypothetical protein